MNQELRSNLVTATEVTAKWFVPAVVSLVVVFWFVGYGFGFYVVLFLLLLFVAIFFAYIISESKQEIRDKTQAKVNAAVQEIEYLKWCDSQAEEEKVLQAAADGLLRVHDWDGMPRIKVRLNPELEANNDRSAHYQGSFYGHRKPGGQAIEYKPSAFYSYSSGTILYIIKHEMVHAWIDWKRISVSDPHGPEFQRKLDSIK